MEFLQRAKVFRLKSSHQSKYLIADQDQETVKQSRDNSSPNARWSFELVEGKANVIRLRSCQSWKYLAASDEQFLLGMTGKRVTQRPYLGPTVEWEPIKEGPYIKLKNHVGGTFLRANRGPPPWRNTITHDVQGHWTSSDSMILWIVDILEIERSPKDDDSKAKEIIKENNIPSFSSNVVDHRILSSSSSLSNDDASSSVENSASFNNLKSMLAGLDDIYDNAERKRTSDTERVLPLEVNMAKETLNEVKDMKFDAILHSRRYKELNKAINMLFDKQDVANIQEKLKGMINDYDLATQDLVEYAAFADKRSEIKAELDKDVAKASVLEATLERWFSNEVVNAGAQREELLKELEETESSLKAVEVLKSRIENKSQILEEIDAKEESWLARKVEAQRKLDTVEQEWVKIKTLFQHDLLN